MLCVLDAQYQEREGDEDLTVSTIQKDEVGSDEEGDIIEGE